jgi:hypothetical protein
MIRFLFTSFGPGVLADSCDLSREKLMSLRELRKLSCAGRPAASLLKPAQAPVIWERVA